MPKENKKRGRRAEHKKRKLHVLQQDDNSATKRHKLQEDPDEQCPQDVSEAPSAEHPQAEGGDDYGDQQHSSGGGMPLDRPFYGLLDEEEQEYFRKAGELLELNQFPSPEERDAFLASIYREADGKELKLANSQSCSRLMERLIQSSTTEQLKILFQKFSNNFLFNVQHRFASHCCEALFIKAAPIVTVELKHQSRSKKSKKAESSEESPAMADLFLGALAELEEHLGYLMTEKYATHALRILLLVLAGQPILRTSGKSGLQSRKKENVAIIGGHVQDPTILEVRDVPDSFRAALEHLISQCVAGLDTTYMRALASHPTGNPTLQLLLRVELTQFGKQRAKDESSIIHILLPDDPITEDCSSASFINGLVYDPIGSRLLETILEHAPGKTYKAIYKGFFRNRLATLARNDVASYVVSKALLRLSKEDLQDAIQVLSPQIPTLLERNRLLVIRTLIEQCSIRGADTTPIADQLQATYAGTKGFDVARLLKLGDSHQTADTATPNPNPTSSTAAGAATATDKKQPSLLAQTMLATPGPLSDLLLSSISALPAPLIYTLVHDSATSPTIIAALTSPHASPITRRKLIARFYGQVAAMALDPAASRVVDAVWPGTNGLAFIRERVAEELAENEPALRQSAVGRLVWRNWRMDLYKRRRRDWVLQSRTSAGSDGFVGFPDGVGVGGGGRAAAEGVRPGTSASASSSAGGSGAVAPGSGGGASRPAGKKPQSAIERARERHASQKLQREKMGKGASGGGSGGGGGQGTDANAVKVKATEVAIPAV